MRALRDDNKEVQKEVPLQSKSRAVTIDRRQIHARSLPPVVHALCLPFDSARRSRPCDESQSRSRRLELNRSWSRSKQLYSSARQKRYNRVNRQSTTATSAPATRRVCFY